MKLKKLVNACALLCLSSLFAQYASAADLSIVIDDSAGMCGYLNAPAERNAYKKSLMRLLQAKDASHLDINAYFLSDLGKPLSVGTVLDQIGRSTATNCPFHAATSPLHAGIDLKKVKSASVILVTDLLFDEGAQGSSDSRSAFVNAFDQLARSKQKNASEWFSTSAGIIGIKSPFVGAYYSTQGQARTDFTESNVERPFYLVWLSSTPKIFPYLNQLNQLWGTVNWTNKKLAIEGIYPIRLLPLSHIISPKQGLFLAPVKSSFSPGNNSYVNMKAPTIYYGKRSKLMDDVLPIDGSGKNPTPLECFNTTANPLLIKFSSSCAKGGSNEQAFYAAEPLPQDILLAYPLNNYAAGLNRIFNVQTVEGGFNNPAEAYYRTLASSQAFARNNPSGKDTANVIVKINGLRGSKSLISNSQLVQNKQLQLKLRESYSVDSSATQGIVPVATQYWSGSIEPCAGTTPDCQKAASGTYQLEGLVNSLITKLNANATAAALLNQQPQTATTIIIDGSGSR